MKQNIQNLLRSQLVEHEGLEHTVYPDSKGILTIGIGRNLTDPGLSDDEINYLFQNDVKRAYDLCKAIFGDKFDDFTENRQVAFMDMAFMGPRLAGFKKMIAAAKRGDWEEAARQALDSKWALEDVQRSRSSKVASQIRGG
jgi:lysozyme